MLKCFELENIAATAFNLYGGEMASGRFSAVDDRKFRDLLRLIYVDKARKKEIDFFLLTERQRILRKNLNKDEFDQLFNNLIGR